MPPPPVGGAAVGNGLGVGLAVGLGEGLGLAEVVADGLDLGVADRLGEGLGLGVDVGDPFDLLGEAVGVAVEDEVDDDVGAAPGDAGDEQAETVTDANRTKMPQTTALSRTLSLVPAAVVPTFMEPPHASAGPTEDTPESARGHNTKANSRPRDAMARYH